LNEAGAWDTVKKIASKAGNGIKETAKNTAYNIKDIP